MGFDIVAFSGGKDISGPQATGFIIGKENLLRWALLNMSPQENRIGRVCKVGKESLFGLLKAVELFVNQDYDATLKKYDAKADTITNALTKYGVTMTRTYNGEALGNVSPHYTWTWDADKVKITNQEVMQKLGETQPVAIGAPPGHGMGAGGMSGRPDPNWTGPNDSAGGRWWRSGWSRSRRCCSGAAAVLRAQRLAGSSGRCCGRRSRWPWRRSKHLRVLHLAAEGWRGQVHREPAGGDILCRGGSGRLPSLQFQGSRKEVVVSTVFHTIGRRGHVASPPFI